MLSIHNLSNRVHQNGLYKKRKTARGVKTDDFPLEMNQKGRMSQMKRTVIIKSNYIVAIRLSQVNRFGCLFLY